MKKWTGERLETDIMNENTLEHLHRYALAGNLVKDKIVLDIASGEGYGSNLLSKNAKHVVGVDISSETIVNAKKKYQKNNLVYLVGSATDIPCIENYFDIVVSFETIEHHDKHEEMMIEIKRVLKPDGILIISTPDKKYYSDKTNYKNPFHIKELTLDEFKKLIGSHFLFIDYLFQKCTFNSIIFKQNRSVEYKEYSGDYLNISQLSDPEYVYIIALCSNTKLPPFEEISTFQNTDILQKLLVANVNLIKAGFRYRLGDFLLKPVSLLKRIFNF